VLTKARARAEAYLQSLTETPAPAPSRRSVYLAISELRRRSEQAGLPSSLALAPYELNVFSQNGEDGVLDEILRRLGIVTGTFVEFGAGAGAEGTCVYLADVGGWEGWFIEPDPAHFQVLSAKYTMSSRVVTHRAAVTPANVESLFAQLQVPENLEVLSIDIDTHEYWVWQALTRYRPRVMVVEYNAHLGLQPLTVPLDSGRAWDGTDYFGASLGALRALGLDKGYELIHCDLSGVNAFFVRQDLMRGRFPVGDEVVLRSPNYFLRGGRHPPGGGRWVDVGDSHQP
jgi:hypothetical protein